jgi:uncharacterized phiE125 gp8 family phage protein
MAYMFSLRRHEFRYRSLVRITEPAVEPVTLLNAKAHLRIDEDFTDDDLYIQALISAARFHVEAVCDVSLIRSQWRMKFDMFPSRDLPLPRPPIATGPITVEYVPVGGGPHIPYTDFTQDRDSIPAILRPSWDEYWPNARGAENDVVVTFYAGYGDSPQNVPAPARHAMLMLVGTWYSQRESIVQGAMNPVPHAVDLLLGSINWGQYR